MSTKWRSRKREREKIVQLFYIFAYVRMCKNFLRIPFSIRCSFEFVLFSFSVSCSQHERTNVMETEYTWMYRKTHTHICIHISNLDIHMFFSDVDIYNMESVLILMVDAGHWTNFIRLSFSLVMCVCYGTEYTYMCWFRFYFHICSVLFRAIHIAPIRLEPKQYTTIKWSARMYRAEKNVLEWKSWGQEPSQTRDRNKKRRKNFQRISHSVYRSSPHSTHHLTPIKTHST